MRATSATFHGESATSHMPADLHEAVSTGLRPSPEMLARVPRISAEARNDCVLFGPPGAGQTSLIAAFPRAAAVGGQLGVIPLPSLVELAARAMAAHRGSGPPLTSTERPASYGLQLRLPDGPSADGSSQVEIQLRDWPGRWLFPDAAAAPEVRSRRIERFVEEAREAACLVLCLDAQNPRRGLDDGLLPVLLSRLAVSAGSLVPRLSSSNGHGGLPPVLTPRLVLPFERVLVLMTKADLLCGELIESLSAAAKLPGSVLEATAARLTRTVRDAGLSLDPLRLAEESLDDLLASLHSALRPEAALAVGLASSRGLDDREIEPAAGDPARTAGAPSESTPPVFPPFGLLESLLFIATGRAQPPIELVGTRSPSRANEYWIELLP